ncbi:hypothetical protein JTB14_033282 [Gonioctena quinquepunctata]|nr:hypothetical protein JTB14_033282 [Gonioctena quinquepunctata]
MNSNKKTVKSSVIGNFEEELSESSEYEYSRINRRSSTRIRNIKDSPKIESPQILTGKKLPKANPNQQNIDRTNNESVKNDAQRELETLQALFDESYKEDSFEPIFADISEQTTKSRSLLPNVLPDNPDNIPKERKFFKRDKLSPSKPSIAKTYIATSSSLQPEDVSKVFKIISQPNNLDDVSDPKPKLSLKTYSNPRKSLQKRRVIESFGLPDTPIVPEKPLINKILDTEILDASEITILDVKCIDDPWDTTNIDQHDLFSDLEEIRVKSDPQKHFRLRHPSGNIEDIKNNGIIFTSTPQVKSSKPPKINISVKNSNFPCEKEVNIDAIKSNIRKLLNEKSSEVSPKKVQRDNSHKRASIITNLVSPTKTSKLQNNQVQQESEVKRQNLRSSRGYQESILSDDTKKNYESSPRTDDSSFEIIHSCNKDENIDEEVEQILNKQKNGSSVVHMKNRKKIDSMEKNLRINIESDEIIATPRRLLRSKSSLDVTSMEKTTKLRSEKKLFYRNVRTSLGMRLRSLSQDNVSTSEELQKNKEITSKFDITPKNIKKYMNDFNNFKKSADFVKQIPTESIASHIKAKKKSETHIPQLKVLLSPLKTSLAINDAFASPGNTLQNSMNTTKKSLRSYKDSPKTPTDTKSFKEKLVSSERDNKIDRCSMEEEVEKYLVKTQISNENSLTTKNNDLDSNLSQKSVSSMPSHEKVVETNENLSLFSHNFSENITENRQISHNIELRGESSIRKDMPGKGEYEQKTESIIKGSKEAYSDMNISNIEQMTESKQIEKDSKKHLELLNPESEFASSGNTLQNSMNTTKKSLRSYKDSPKTPTDTKSCKEKLVSSDRGKKIDRCSREEEVEKCLVKTLHVPQIFEKNSLSFKNNDFDSNLSQKSVISMPSLEKVVETNEKLSSDNISENISENCQISHNIELGGESSIQKDKSEKGEYEQKTESVIKSSKETYSDLNISNIEQIIENKQLEKDSKKHLDTLVSSDNTLQNSMNTTRKSLRSYKDSPKTHTGTKSSKEKSFSSKRDKKVDRCSLEEEVEKCLVKTLHVPQILDENSLSSENNDLDSNLSVKSGEHEQKTKSVIKGSKEGDSDLNISNIEQMTESKQLEKDSKKHLELLNPESEFASSSNTLQNSMNTTKKSLRSYTDSPKTPTDTKSSKEKLFSPKRDKKVDRCSLEEEVEKCLVRTLHVPQILDENSLSSENNNLDSNLSLKSISSMPSLEKVVETNEKLSSDNFSENLSENGQISHNIELGGESSNQKDMSEKGEYEQKTKSVIKGSKEADSDLNISNIEQMTESKQLEKDSKKHLELLNPESEFASSGNTLQNSMNTTKKSLRSYTDSPKTPTDTKSSKEKLFSPKRDKKVDRCSLEEEVEKCLVRTLHVPQILDENSLSSENNNLDSNLSLKSISSMPSLEKVVETNEKLSSDNFSENISENGKISHNIELGGESSIQKDMSEKGEYEQKTDSVIKGSKEADSDLNISNIEQMTESKQLEKDSKKHLELLNPEFVTKGESKRESSEATQKSNEVAESDTVEKIKVTEVENYVNIESSSNTSEAEDTRSGNSCTATVSDETLSNSDTNLANHIEQQPLKPESSTDNQEKHDNIETSGDISGTRIDSSVPLTDEVHSATKSLIHEQVAIQENLDEGMVLRTGDLFNANQEVTTNKLVAELLDNKDMEEFSSSNHNAKGLSGITLLEVSKDSKLPAKKKNANSLPQNENIELDVTSRAEVKGHNEETVSEVDECKHIDKNVNNTKEPVTSNISSERHTISLKSENSHLAKSKKTKRHGLLIAKEQVLPFKLRKRGKPYKLEKQSGPYKLRKQPKREVSEHKHLQSSNNSRKTFAKKDEEIMSIHGITEKVNDLKTQEKLLLFNPKNNGELINKVIQVSASKNEILDLVPNQPVRKRGRPRKIINSENTQPLPTYINNGQMENKIEAQLDVSTNQNLGSLTPDQTAVPMKRGRPSKVITLPDQVKKLINHVISHSSSKDPDIFTDSIQNENIDCENKNCNRPETPETIVTTPLQSHSSPSQTKLFSEDVFDLQNTIADHVKKRSREAISYKMSGTNRLSSGGIQKSHSFETSPKQTISKNEKNGNVQDNSVALDSSVEKIPLPTSSPKCRVNEVITSNNPAVNMYSTGNNPLVVENSSLVEKKQETQYFEEDMKLHPTKKTDWMTNISHNQNCSVITKKSISRGKPNHDSSNIYKGSTVSDIEKELDLELDINVQKPSLGNGAQVTVKTILRSKTSLGARVKGTDIEDVSLKVNGRPRRKSLDQAISSETNSKLKKNDVTLPSKKLRSVDLEILRDLKGDLVEFKVGSLAWAQIGSFPYWPCLVTKEMGTGIFRKNVLSKNVTRTLYHVRFFGDKGRRAWISKHKLMIYSSKKDLENIYNKMKLSNKFWYDIQHFFVKTIYQKKWTGAVEEAEQIKSKNLKEKLQFFETHKATQNNSENINTNKLVESIKKKARLSKSDQGSSTNDVESNNTHQSNDIKSNEIPVFPVKVKSKTKKSEISIDPCSSSHLDTNKIQSSPVKNKTKISKSNSLSTLLEADGEKCKKPRRDIENELKLPRHENNLSKQDVENEEIKMTNKVETCLEEPFAGENQMTDQLAIKKSDEAVSETGSKSSIDSLAMFSSHSLEAQKALFKRNTLFKGVSKEKVCQFCYEPGDVLKCKGGCNGVYHVHCAVKVLQDKTTRGRPRGSCQKIESILEEKDIKEEPVETDKQNNAHSIDDEHVQIITVPSSVYNTPPRKTFPPNFENLSLAEQIDYKMKEIMKKFESKTTYSESIIDTRNTEYNLGIHSLSRTRNFSRSQALFPPMTQKNNVMQSSSDSKMANTLMSPSVVMASSIESKGVWHITADSTIDQTSSSEAEELSVKSVEMKVKSRNDMDLPTKHVTGDSPAESPLAGSSSLIEKEVTIIDKEMIHVTADCEVLETLQSENSNSNSSQQYKRSDNGESTEGAKYVNPKHFKCGFCKENFDPFCFVCLQYLSKKGSNIRQKCSLYQCSRFYHPECLKLWPQTQWSLIQTTKHRFSQEEIDSFVCPQHVCHTCVSDDPRAATSRCSGDKIVKCQRCPSTYHSTNLCVPAGSDILSSTQIICPRHRDKSKNYTINTTWCFLCSEGGNLICCETCPTSVHPECLPVNLTDDDKFICEDCESGRLPLYDEIVWVKLGKFRWWPGLILFPNEIPPNVMNIKHSRGEFVVKFFGTYDHYWVNRGRSFLFQEGDTGDSKVTTKKKVEEAFNRAVEEAVIVHKLKKEFKLTLEAEAMELDLSNTTSCECDPKKPHPCGPDSDCLNRLLLTECNPEVCPAGKRCNNQSFDKREYPPMIPYKTQVEAGA